MPFNVGETVGPYRIMEQLGQGGMATVCKAYHASLDRYVAIKVLHPAFKSDPNFLARFEREAKVVAKLEHPNIVPIYDFAEHEHQPYLVMKYIEGETLKARLQKGPLNATEVQTIIEKIGAGLAYAHKRGILHRDIKPSNVILDQEGGIYLADFGLARIAHAGESSLTTDAVLGTPQYISPEQALGKKELDEGTDIYSFGVMIYEMTVGRVPFSADTPFSVIHDHIYSPLPMPSTVNPAISADLERFLMRCLAKDRADRFADVPSMVKGFNEAWEVSASTQLAAPMPPPVSQSAPAPEPKSASAPRTVVQAAETSSAAEETQQKPPAKRKFRWMWIALAVLFSLCCILLFFVARGRDQGNAQSVSQATATVVQEESQSSSAEESLSPEVENLLVEKLSLEAAQKAVEENPDEPRAHLLLAVALLDNGEEDSGYDEVYQSADLAFEQNNRAFLLGAGHVLQNNEYWLPSAIFFQYLLEGEEFVPSPLTENFLHSIYVAYEDPHAPQYLTFGSLSNVNESVSLFAQARYTLVNRTPEEAEILINELLTKRGFTEKAKLLQAEMLYYLGNDENAKLLLEEILENETSSQWMLDEADFIYSQIK